MYRDQVQCAVQQEQNRAVVHCSCSDRGCRLAQKNKRKRKGPADPEQLYVPMRTNTNMNRHSVYEHHAGCPHKPTSRETGCFPPLAPPCSSARQPDSCAVAPCSACSTGQNWWKLQPSMVTCACCPDATATPRGFEELEELPPASVRVNLQRIRCSCEAGWAKHRNRASPGISGEALCAHSAHASR